MNSKVLWITKTAVMLALLVVLQAVTKPLGTIVTGSAVNFILIAATLIGGMSSGLVIALVSPFLAMLLGVVPLPIYVVPVVAVGNAVLVLVYALLSKKLTSNSQVKQYVFWIIAVVISAVLKFLALFALSNYVVMPLMTAIKDKMAKVPAAIFSTQQMLTAVIGGVLAVLIIPTVLKAIGKKD